MPYPTKKLPGGNFLGRLYNAKGGTTSLPTAPDANTDGVVKVDGYQWLDLHMQVGTNDVDVALWVWMPEVAAWTKLMAFGVNGALTLDQTNHAAQVRSVEVNGAYWAFLQITGVGGGPGTLTAHAYGTTELGPQ